MVTRLSTTQILPDGFDLTMSVDLLRDDGRMNFKVLCGGTFGTGNAATITADLDVMPNVGRPAVTVQ